MKTTDKQTPTQPVLTDNCPKCRFKSKVPFDECPRCGLIMAKYWWAKQAQKEAQELRKGIQQVESTIDLMRAKNIMILGVAFECVGTIFLLLWSAGVIDKALLGAMGWVIAIIGGIITIVSTYKICDGFGFSSLRTLLSIFANCLIFLNMFVTLGLVVQYNRMMKERVITHLDALGNGGPEKPATSG